MGIQQQKQAWKASIDCQSRYKRCKNCGVKVWGTPYSVCPRCGGQLLELLQPHNR